jgi:hypothetical protein
MITTATMKISITITHHHQHHHHHHQHIIVIVILLKSSCNPCWGSGANLFVDFPLHARVRQPAMLLILVALPRRQFQVSIAACLAKCLSTFGVHAAGHCVAGWQRRTVQPLPCFWWSELRQSVTPACVEASCGELQVANAAAATNIFL